MVNPTLSEALESNLGFISQEMFNSACKRLVERWQSLGSSNVQIRAHGEVKKACSISLLNPPSRATSPSLLHDPSFEDAQLRHRKTKKPISSSHVLSLLPVSPTIRTKKTPNHPQMTMTAPPTPSTVTVTMTMTTKPPSTTAQHCQQLNSTSSSPKATASQSSTFSSKTSFHPLFRIKEEANREST